MMSSAIETEAGKKAIRRLIEVWKKNQDIRQKALLILQKNPVVKTRKNNTVLLPGNAFDFSKFR